MTDTTTEPTTETFAEWYGNGDTGEDMVADGMGNGACLYRLDNGELWFFEWDDQGFDYCGKTSREEWDQFAAGFDMGEEDGQ